MYLQSSERDQTDLQRLSSFWDDGHVMLVHHLNNKQIPFKKQFIKKMMMMMMMMLIACMAAINDNADNAYDNADYMGDEDFTHYDI